MCSQHVEKQTHTTHFSPAYMGADMNTDQDTESRTWTRARTSRTHAYSLKHAYTPADICKHEQNTRAHTHASPRSHPTLRYWPKNFANDVKSPRRQKSALTSAGNKHIMYARRSTVLILTWSSAYQLAQLWACGVPLLGDKSSVPRSLKSLSCVAHTAFGSKRARAHIRTDARTHVSD